MLKVKLKPGREVSILRRHPWIFSGALQSLPKQLNLDEIVEVQSADGSFLASGYWNDGSIAIKILSFAEKTIDAHYWRSAIAQASASDVNAFSLRAANATNLPTDSRILLTRERTTFLSTTGAPLRVSTFECVDVQIAHWLRVQEAIQRLHLKADALRA